MNYIIKEWANRKYIPLIFIKEYYYLYGTRFFSDFKYRKFLSIHKRIHNKVYELEVKFSNFENQMDNYELCY